MNYYKFNIGDYAAATRHLSMLEHGAYRLLLDLYYTTEKPIPSNLKDAARKAGARGKDELQAVETVLAEFFTLSDAGWTHSRCDSEIAAYQQKAETNRAVGMRGGRPKKQTAMVQDENPNGFQKETQTVSKKNPNQEPLTTNQEPINKSSCSSESSREFDDDDAPKDPATWAEVFANDHGIDIDHRSAQSRAKFWPLAKGWVQAGVTVGQMRRACAKAREEATEPIAWMPAYVDRVLASMQAPQRQPKQAAEPEWRTEQRNRTLQAVPGIAARTQTPTNIIDVKATNVSAIALD